VFLPRYCPVPWTEYLSSGDPVSACLSAMFADLLSGGLSSSVQTRLIAVNQPGAEGWRYYDTCPDFSKGGSIDLSGWNGEYSGLSSCDTADNVNKVYLSCYFDTRATWHLVDLSGTTCVQLGVYYT